MRMGLIMSERSEAQGSHGSWPSGQVDPGRSGEGEAAQAWSLASCWGRRSLCTQHSAETSHASSL